MDNYPVAVAGIFSKTGESEPICSICFFATEPANATIEDVESCIYSNVFPALAKMIVNCSAAEVSTAINTCATQIETTFDVDCVGYLNEAFMSGTSKKQKGERK